MKGENKPTMKKLFLSISLVLVGIAAVAQQTREIDEINDDNSWLKLGINMGAPVGDISTISSFAFGVEVAGQFMRTDNFGLGAITGYTNYFAKSDIGGENFGAIPLGLMLRYYPQSSGVFVGTDVGYSFLTGSVASNGGAYIRPQVGYHNYNWNIFAFYNQIFTSSSYVDVQSIGVAATYNIRFK